MFQNLADKFDAVFRKLKGRGKLSEADIDATLREVKLALLEADVNFKVVRDFTAHIREKTMGKEVLESLTPAQQVIKIVHGELAAILGGSRATLNRASIPPTRILMVGLQGSGKTTTCAKLALHLKEQGYRPYLVPADLSRPAAVDQLISVAGKVGVPVYRSDTSMTPVQVFKAAAVEAGRAGCDTVIVDTAGRLHVDEKLMEEVTALAGTVGPHETLLVADAMTGQDAVRIAESFHGKLTLTGIILSKLDGDARGGAALSMRRVTGVPVKFAGVGEGMDGLEPFHPDRVASRILGMGDMLTLIDKAEKAFNEKEAAKLVKKTRKGEFDLTDFRDQLRKMGEMGSMQEILSMLPLPGKMKKALPSGMDDREIVRITAIIDSMTARERRNPKILNGSRRKRISAGSGTTVTDVNRLLKQFDQAKKMMKKIGKGGKGMGLPF
ncbi:MAG: signal recognition particle protein [bacterium]|nr:signal recognition particle protein [bacterium]MDT8395154.1 signal recognition particle protein [bacterium]